MSSAPNARIAAFFSAELPCGTTIATGTFFCALAKANDWPWLPRVETSTAAFLRLVAGVSNAGAQGPEKTPQVTIPNPTKY
jgi:hypothetical protein